MRERDSAIDWLRFLGLSLIILAHVQPPFILSQIRCFDVPLMLFVSGLTVSGKKIDSHLQYIGKRTKRLIIPVWLFLAIYLTSLYFVQFRLLPEQYLTVEMIWRSFFLLDRSIGYVWIIRVFLIVMLVTPIVLKLNEKVKSNIGFLFILFSLLLGTQFLYILICQMPRGVIVDLLENIVLYGVAYIVPFMLGIRYRSITRKEERYIAGIIIVISITILVYFFYVHGCLAELSPAYKEPPRTYFVIYGIFMSTLLWRIRSFWKTLSNLKLCVWIGQNTIWIYLWHMPLALLSTRLPVNWICKYLIVYGGAISIFYIQYKIVRKINIRVFNKYLIG